MLQKKQATQQSAKHAADHLCQRVLWRKLLHFTQRPPHYLPLCCACFRRPSIRGCLLCLLLLLPLLLLLAALRLRLLMLRLGLAGRFRRRNVPCRLRRALRLVQRRRLLLRLLLRRQLLRRPLRAPLPLLRRLLRSVQRLLIRGFVSIHDQRLGVDAVSGRFDAQVRRRHCQGRGQGGEG